MSTSDVLNRAADIAEQRWGYAEGEWDWRGDRPVCIEGALAEAMEFDLMDGRQVNNERYAEFQASEPYRALIGTINAKEGTSLENAWIWQDRKAGRVGRSSTDAELSVVRDKMVSILREAANA